MKSSMKSSMKSLKIYVKESIFDNIDDMVVSNGEVGEDFNCSNCDKLRSLEDGPEKLKGYLCCKTCKNLKITDSDRKKI